MIKFNLEDGTFEHSINVSIEDLRNLRDGLQLKVDEATTSPEPNITERLNSIRTTAEALGIEDNINWSADQ